MKTFKKSQRQAVIDAYLQETGKNMFHAVEFVDWLRDRVDHEWYPLFYGKDDAVMAHAHRVNIARRMISGLRIVAKVSEIPQNARVVNISVREYPAYTSPMANRKHGGGYVRFDPSDGSAMVELQKQAAQSLRGWLNRYRGAAQNAGLDMSIVEDMIGQLEGQMAKAS